MELKRIGGAALFLGAVLNITRVIPIFANAGVSPDNFPPHSVAEIVFVAQTFGWHISHIMGLISLPLLMFGLAVLFVELKMRGETGHALAALVGAGFALILYLGGLVIEGLVLPSVIASEAQAFQAGDPQAAHAIELVHMMATPFGGFGAAVMLINSTFLGLAVLRGFGQPALGLFGTVIGILSLAGFSTGILSLDIVETLRLVGPLSILNFLFFMAVGITLLRSQTEH